MASDLFTKDRAGLMERLGRLLGSTTYRDPSRAGGGEPFVLRGMTSEGALILALKMGGTHGGDVGPWIAYSIALRIDDRQREVVEWLARKLESGTGSIGSRNANRMLIVALAAYRLAVHGIEPAAPKVRAAEFKALVNIGAGWLWMKSESTVDRAEYAYHAHDASLREKMTEDACQ